MSIYHGPRHAGSGFCSSVSSGRCFILAIISLTTAIWFYFVVTYTLIRVLMMYLLVVSVCCKGPFRRLAAHQRFCKGITEKPRGNIFGPDCGKGPYKRVDVHQHFCKKQQPLRGSTRQDAATSQSCPLDSVENDAVDESLGVRHKQPSTTLSYLIRKSMPCDPTSDPVSNSGRRIK